jgi:hypothetical protein
VLRVCVCRLGCEKRRLTVTVPSAAMHERTLVVTVAIFLNLAAARRHVSAVVFGGAIRKLWPEVKSRREKKVAKNFFFER